MQTRCGSALLSALRMHAQDRPDAEAVGEIGSSEVCTYGELAAMVDARASLLRERAAPGSVVVCVMPAGAELVAWFCSAIAAGVRLLPMHPQIAGPEAVGAAERAGAVAAVIGDGIGAAWTLAGLENLRNARVTRRAATQRWNATGGVVLGSSGTTGLPKLALRESASLDADARGVVEGLRLTHQDRVIFVTPLSHSYGIDVLAGVLLAGASLRVAPSFDAELVARELETGATALPAVPFVFEALARRGRTCGTVLRVAVSAGSPLPEGVRASFADAWGAPVGQLYGATELGAVTMDTPDLPGFDPASVGKPVRGVSARIVDVDDADRTLKQGEEGQLAVRAASMLSRYLDGETPVRDGHFLTGDLARIGPDGRVYITGRIKHLVDVGAYKVNPLEVEAVLCSHPGVAECVVVGAAASETVSRLKAVIVPRDPYPTAESLRRFVRERLSAVKVPRTVEFVPSLPKTATGKVQRDRL
ncbi:MAG TPA: fatty acid--CoA ligase family protein [Phycisphaerales bacterium]|nr:fatty acid--CoA ligase family protein [Phycisphaerales bacterium]